MKLCVARKFAEKVMAGAMPYVDRIEVAGSTRRGRPEPNDLDFVCIPTDRDGLRRRFEENCTPIELGKVNWSFKHPTGLRIDIYLAHARVEAMFEVTASNWGALLLTRTGSKVFNQRLALQAQARNLQWKPYCGVVNNHGDLVAGETEQEIFQALGLGWIDPERRER